MSHMVIEIPDVNKKVFMPLELNACDRQQYIDFCSLLYNFEKDATVYEDFRVDAVYKLLNLKRGKRKIDKGEVQEALGNIYAISESIDCFFEQNAEGQRILKHPYTHNHLKYLRPRFIKYVGPSDYFLDCYWNEYREGINIVMMYLASPDPKLLYRLLAVFFRKRKKGQREMLDEEKIDKRAQLFSSYPIGYAFAFFRTLYAFHRYFTSSSVMYEGREIDLSIIFTEQPEDTVDDHLSPYPSLGMQSIEYQIAQTNVLGNNRQIETTKLWKVALTLYDIRKRDLDEKARSGKNKS